MKRKLESSPILNSVAIHQSRCTKTVLVFLFVENSGEMINEPSNIDTPRGEHKFLTKSRRRLQKEKQQGKQNKMRHLREAFGVLRGATSACLPAVTIGPMADLGAKALSHIRQPSNITFASSRD
jgi:hypothetical protein